jgi:AraC-like DNA-binding protein
VAVSMCPLDPDSGAQSDWHALRVSFRKQLQRLLDGKLGTAACLDCWICVRDSNWGGREPNGTSFCLLASNDLEDEANTSLLIREAVARAIFEHAACTTHYDSHPINAFVRGIVRADSILLPLTYQRNLFGIACLDLKPAARRLFDHCASELSLDLIYHVRRYQVSCLIKQHHQKELALIGASEASRQQDIFVERASQAELPVLILGESGCESEYIARALHLAGRRMNRPFVLCDCLAGECCDQHSLEEALRQAQGGSLFLENVDALPFKGQVALSQLLSQYKTQDFVPARILASSSDNIHEAMKRKEFYAPLLRHLDFLSTVVAPLRLRREDIRSMSEFFCTKYSGKGDIALSREAAAALEAFHWPGNVEQLEKVIAALVVLRRGTQIELLDLQHYAPAVLLTVQNNGLRNPGPPTNNGQDTIPSEHPLKWPPWAGIASDLKHCHSAVRKAVEYLIKHYNRPLTLKMVASQACVSPSHLCVLLKRSLGMSFKTLVMFLRIEKAKDLFTSRPELRITDVSMEVGFNDLGHFERVFKRIAGCTPSVYRRTLRSEDDLSKTPLRNDRSRFATAS